MTFVSRVVEADLRTVPVARVIVGSYGIYIYIHIYISIHIYIAIYNLYFIVPK